MPTLSLSPALTGSPPESETARANGGTEGREGENTALSNGGVKENAWTRLFQSYIQQNKQTAVTASKSPVKSGSEKDLLSSDASSANVSLTSPVSPASVQAVIVTPIQSTAQAGDADTFAATAGPAVNAAKPLTQPAMPATTALNEALDTIGSAAPTQVIAPQSLISTPITMSTTTTWSDAPAAEKVKQRPNAPTAVDSAAASITSASSQTIVTAPSSISPAQSSTRTSAITTAASGKALAASRPSNSSTLRQTARQNGNAGTQSTAVLGNASNQQPAPTDTAASAATATPTVNAPPNAVQATLPQNLPASIVSTITAVQTSVTPLQQTGTAASPSNKIATNTSSSSSSSIRGDMEREQVLGASPLAELRPVTGKDRSGSSDSFTGEDLSKAADSSDQTASASGSANTFSNTLADTTSAGGTPVTATNATLVQSSSLDERIAVVNQISQHIQSMQPSTANPNTMTVTVQPPHWGEVKIAVTLNPQTAGYMTPNISATVTASTTEVQGALQEHIQDLRNSLGNAGLHIYKLDVAVGTVAAMSQSGSSSGHHSGQQTGSNNQQFQTNWTGTSTSSNGSGSQSQSTPGWGADKSDGDGAAIMPASASIDTNTAAASQAATPTTSRIDMRA